MYWNCVAWNEDHWWDYVNTVMNIVFCKMRAICGLC